MPRGVKTSEIPKSVLVKKLCKIINIPFNGDVFNSKNGITVNGTVTKRLLQEVCNCIGIPNSYNLTKEACANEICNWLPQGCNSIDFNSKDDTGSAGFIEKILNQLS